AVNRQAVSVEAVTELDVLSFNVDRLRRFVRSEPEVGWALAQLVGSVATEVIDMMSSTVFGSVRRRLSRHLLDLAIQQSGELVVVQDQQEMADAIGSVREVVGRTLRELRDRGLVARTELGLRIDDPNGLYIVSTLG
ncbi:Crp/Fnr family transcriptional regulator, partial [Gordonia aichiensis]